jgi:hypothetical protein
LFPERLEDYLSDDNPVRAVDVFVDELPEGQWRGHPQGLP